MQRLLPALLLMSLCLPAVHAKTRFPGVAWESRAPAEVGVDSEALDALADRLGGRGCVIKDGYIVKEWGDPKSPDNFADLAAGWTGSRF